MAPRVPSEGGPERVYNHVCVIAAFSYFFVHQVSGKMRTDWYFDHRASPWNCSPPSKKLNEIREKYTIRWYKSTAEHATVLKMTMQRMLSRCDVRQSRAEADENVFRFAGICWWTKVLRRNYRCDLMMVQDANTCILWPICARDIFFRKCDLFGLLTVLETKKSGAYQSQYGSSSEDREYLYKV